MGELEDLASFGTGGSQAGAGAWVGEKLWAGMVIVGLGRAVHNGYVIAQVL